MAKKFINVSEVTINGRKMYRARLTFPFDDELGYRRPPKDFYGKTKEEADRKRKEFEIKGEDEKRQEKAINLLDFINKKFLPEQEAKGKLGSKDAGGFSWRYYEHRKRRLEKYLLDPSNEHLKGLKLRSVRLSLLNPVHLSEFFKTLLLIGARQEDRRRLKDDLLACFRSAKHHLPYKDMGLYFNDDLEVPALPKRKADPVLFDPHFLGNILIDPNLPIEDRALVAFEFIMQCRPQEIFALTWVDVNLEVGTVTFNKRVTKEQGSWAVVPGTKTGESGIRTQQMGQFLTGLMRELYQKRSSGFVFQTRYGEMLHKERFKDFWPLVRESLGLPKGPTFYSLKHLGNSFAQENGITAQAQAKRMGHTDDRMARQVYRIVSKTEADAAAEVFGKLFTQKQLQ